jgi:putative membrane protein
MTVALSAVAIALTPDCAHAHAGRPPEPHDLWTAWSADPAVVAALALSAWLYARGVRRLWRRAGTGRGTGQWQAWSFAAGWIVLAVALLSPLHRLGSALFSAHMAQHELLVSVAAPLLVLGHPVVPSLWAVPSGWRRTVGGWARARPVRAIWRWLTLPLVAFALHSLALWLWHLPAAYQATLRSDAAHAAQHASFLGTALLFWWVVLHARGRRVAHGPAVFYLFATVLHTGVLGAVLALAPTVLYPDYVPWTRAWGLTPLEDQQLGGLIMWMPGGLSYVAAGLALVADWLKESGRRAEGRERVTAPAAP